MLAAGAFCRCAAGVEMQAAGAAMSVEAGAIGVDSGIKRQMNQSHLTKHQVFVQLPCSFGGLTQLTHPCLKSDP